MSRDIRRLLKRPRTPFQWPIYLYPLISSLLIAAASVVWLVIVVRPSEFPPTKVPDQWAAEAAVIGGGALFFAVVATIIATVAFINASERPTLRLLDVSHRGMDPDKPWRTRSVQDLKYEGTRAEFDGWFLTLRVVNTGRVAARFVALRVTFDEGVHLALRDPDELLPWQTHSTRATYARTRRSAERIYHANRVGWEGGADVVIHPSWEYEIPRLGFTKLSVVGPHSRKMFQVHLELVADSVPTFTTSYTVYVRQDR